MYAFYKSWFRTMRNLTGKSPNCKRGVIRNKVDLIGWSKLWEQRSFTALTRNVHVCSHVISGPTQDISLV